MAAADGRRATNQLPNNQPTAPQINGIGKFPYLSIEHSTVDFGNVLVGRTVERTFKFGNHSVVDAHFSVTHEEGPDDGVFTVTPGRQAARPP